MKLSGTIGVTQKTMTLDTHVRLILLQTLNPQERWGTHKKRWPFQPRLFADVIGLVRCSYMIIVVVQGPSFIPQQHGPGSFHSGPLGPVDIRSNMVQESASRPSQWYDCRPSMCFLTWMLDLWLWKTFLTQNVEVFFFLLFQRSQDTFHDHVISSDNRPETPTVTSRETTQTLAENTASDLGTLGCQCEIPAGEFGTGNQHV